MLERPIGTGRGARGCTRNGRRTATLVNSPGRRAIATIFQFAAGEFGHILGEQLGPHHQNAHHHRSATKSVKPRTPNCAALGETQSVTTTLGCFRADEQCGRTAATAQANAAVTLPSNSRCTSDSLSWAEEFAGGLLGEPLLGLFVRPVPVVVEGCLWSCSRSKARVCRWHT